MKTGVQLLRIRGRTPEHLRAAMWRAFGQALRYPPCCIRAFCEYPGRSKLSNYNTPCAGSGYVPCVLCARQRGDA